MDFELNEDQKEISDLAGRILREQASPERLRAVEADPDGFAHEAWDALARAGLLGVALPERLGGGGFGLVEACLVLEEVGRTVAPIPYLANLAAALAVAEFGSAEQQAGFVAPAIAGSAILTVALCEDGAAFVPATPATRAVRDGEGIRLHGAKALVPALHLATRVLVPASLDDGDVGVFLVDPAAEGVSRERLVATSYEPRWDLHLDGVRAGGADRLAPSADGRPVVDWIAARVLAGLCATASGVCAEALRLTAAHVSEREQFGHKIATFQAVAQRAADAWVDARAIALTARQAAWRLAAGLPADEALAIAKFWAADGGQRVVHAAQHLHGGIGVDVEYPLHRTFRQAKHLELALGGASAHLLRFGAMLAARGPEG